MEKLKHLLASRKFWAAVVGLGMIVLKAYRPEFPLDEDQITSLVVVLVGYMLGVAVEDAGLPRPRNISILRHAPAQTKPPKESGQE